MPNFVDSGYRVIRNFLGTSEELLFSGLIEPNPGQLYGGTTGNFGNGDFGSIFSCNTDGSGYQVLHNFNSVSDGACFRSNFLKGSDGLLYGVTSFGGLNYTVSGGTYNGGTIFTYNTTTDALNILHRFSGITGNDGAEPYSSLIEISGTGIFYGTTRAGGLSSGTVTPQGCGVIYTCNTAGNYGVIHNMLGNGSEGMEPSELLDGGDGFLYGTAFIGGSYGYGTLFRTDLFGNLTVLRNFSGVTYSDGENPVGPLIRASDGLLYGATYLGGLYGYGTIYTYDTTTNVYDIIHNFQYANGGRPLVGLTEYPGSNQIFGVVNSGGSNRTGVVFFIEIGTPNSYTIVHQFYGAPNDGRQPRGKILVGSNGSLFGTTNSSNVFNIDDDDDSYEGVEAGGVIYTWDTAYCQVTASTTFNCLQLLGVQYPPCPGVCTGSLTAFTDTGVDPHTYYLTNIDTSQVFSGNSFPNDVAIFTGLCVGNYSLQAVDSIGFIENYPTTIVLNGTFDVQLVNYIGQSCISIDGGTPPYTILVNGNPITYTLPVSCFPTSCNVVYNVLVTDTNGCQFTGQTTGSCNTNFGVTSTTVTDFTCNNEGTIGINLSGDCTSYEFNLYDYNTSALISGPTIGGSNFIFTGLNPGTYYATVSGCSNPPLLILNNPPFVVNDNDTLFTEVTQLGNNALCVTITGGTQPYQILIDGSLETWSYSQNTNCYYELSCAIDHTVVVIDASGCTATTVTDFTCSTPSISVVSIVQPTCTNDGEITVSISGGTPNYTITATNVTTNQQIIATNVSNTYTFSNLLEGIWTFVASDSDGFIGTVLTVNLLNEFFIDLSFNGINFSGAAEFCFIVTGTTNTLLTTITGPPPLNTLIFLASGDTLNCFTVPVVCGFDYSIKIEENIVSSETCLQVSADDCLPSVQYVRTGTTINGLPSYSFILNNIPYQISWDPTNTYLLSGAWVLTNTITNTVCAYRARTLTFPFSIYPIGQTGQWGFIGLNSPDCVCISLSSQFSTSINNCAGCSDYLEFTVPCGPLGVIISSFSNPFCGCNGQIRYLATGGTSPYTYVISEINSPYQATNTTGIFTGLCEGTYSVVVTDSTGGTATSSSLFLNDTFDVIPTISSTITSAGTSTYCISISGGSGGYDLSIDSYTTGVTNGTYCFELNAGQCYDVVVQDNINANCFYSATTCIPDTIFGCEGITIVEPSCGDCDETIGNTLPPLPPGSTTMMVGTTPVLVETLISNLNIPWSIIYHDDYIWTTERGGLVSRININTGIKQVILNITGTVYAIGEAGLLGMALHPNFPTTSEVFLAYVYDANPAPGITDQTLRVVKYNWNGTILVNPPTILIDNINANNIHNGCRLLFLPDGTLIFSVGDANNATTAQVITSLNGKILRINTDGSIPSDNPYASSTNPYQRYIYTWGHRNPQGLVLMPNNTIISSEHGASAYDEINIISSGNNYGWDDIEGPCLSNPICLANNYIEPLYYWQPTFGPSDLVYYVNPDFPEWDNCLLMTALRGSAAGLGGSGQGRLHALHILPPYTTITSDVWYFEGTFGRLRDITIGPNKEIYLATNGPQYSNTQPNTHKIIKITPLSSINNSLVGGCGSITVSVSGGSPNYEYAIYSGGTLLPPIHTTNSTSYTFTGLTQGEYSILVSDFFSSQVYCYSGITLGTNFFVDIDISGTCESTFNYCLTISGGTPPYTHNTGLNTYTMSSAGTYCYTATCGTYQFVVRDSGIENKQCLYSETVTVNCGLTLSATTELNACGNGGAGAITIYTILGGISPYSYSFDYGQTYYTIPFLNGLTFSSNIFGPLFPAEYPIIIKDLSGCTASTSVTIIDQPIINVSAVTTPENCSYSGNGTITITASGGASPYQYSINDGVIYSPNNYFTGLTIGTYLISVLDADNCEGTTMAIVYPPIVLSGVSTPETCEYSSGGTITVSVIQSTYGTPPYEFSINGITFQSSTLFTGLTVGTYTITVRDISGCTATTTTVVDPPIIISATTTPDNCFSGGVGTILVSASSGLPPYQYSFSGGPFTNLNYFTGLTVGSYTISAIDSTGCSATTIVNIEVADAITITASTTDESCYVSSGGTMFILAEGGIPPYQYSVDYGNTYTTSPYFVGFTIGSYDVYVKDFYGCSATTVVTINSASTISLFQTTALTPTCVGLNILEATLSATGGTVPYTFVWTIPLTPPAYVSSQIITVTDYVFDPGIYSFTGTVYDRFGCSATSVFNYLITSADTPTLQIFSAGTLFCDASQGVILTSSATTSSGFYDEIYWYNLLSGTTPSLITTGTTQITAFTPGIYYYVIDYDICLYSSSTITVDYPKTEPPVIGASVILCPCSSTQLEVIPNGITYTDFVWSDGQSGSTITVSSCTEGEYVYYLTAKDQFNCTVTSNTVTVIYSPLEINVFKVDATCCNCADGFVELQVVNAVGPLTFNWVGTVNSTNTANNLLPGTYTVTVTDTVTNCVSVLTFEIFCEEVVECIYEPIRDANGDIILNPDGTISFYDVTVLPTTRIVDVIPEECCLEYSTTDLLLEHCNGRCYWRQRGCADTSAQKILLGADQTNGVEISDNIDENCQNQITFKYLFNFDCESLFNCVDLSYSGNVLTFLTGLTAYATVEVLTGNTYVTKQTVPIWKFDINKTPTGVYFGGQDNFCDIINELIINQLGSSCTGLTSNTFSPAWQQASFKVYDSLKGKTIKIGLLLEGFNCDYNILVDDIKIEEVCLISNEQLLTDDCVGFELEKIPDNKKSWIYNEDKYDRDWNHLKYRNTSYDDFHERLDINTKEIDLNVDVARAIEYDTYCYSLEVPCYLDDNCTSPERISPTATAQTLSLSTTLTAIFNTSSIRIQTGKIYRLRFRIQTAGPGIPTNLVIGFGNGAAVLYNVPTIILIGGSVGTQDYEYVIDLSSLPSTTYTHLYFRIGPWIPTTVRTYTILGRPSLSMTEICPISKQTLIDNYVNVDSNTTFEEFKSQIQQNLIDPKTRQGISDYPLLRYLYERYLNFCGLNPCTDKSNQYNYNTLTDFVKLIGDYWIDLVEQFVPATAIWKGGSMVYRNTMFDQPKFQYKNFNVGYCDNEYCFEGDDNEPTYPAACYVAITPIQFSTITNNIISKLKPSQIGDLIIGCSDASGIICCNTNPMGCFVSSNVGFKFTDGTQSLDWTEYNNDPNKQTMLTHLEVLNILYLGLSKLGYSRIYPYDNFEWSIQTTNGCSGQIEVTPIINLVYSCVTASTITITGVTGNEISFESIFGDYLTGTQYSNIFPTGKMALSGGTVLYGIATDVNASQNGYIYSCRISGSSFNLVKSFNISVDGVRSPASGLVLASDGYLYGTTLLNNVAGSQSFGALYRVNPLNPNATFTVLRKFSSIDRGTCWLGQEILYHTNNRLYIPLFGSSIYEWNIATQTGTLLFVFPTNNREVFLSENTTTGEIIGTSFAGGTKGEGTIFKLSPSNPVNTYTVLHNFDSSLLAPNNIINPSGPLLQSGTNFYGLTNGNNTGAGFMSLYRFNSTNNTVTPLHRFINPSPPEGRNPKGNLLLIANRIYGICTTGGGTAGSSTTNLGTIFRYDLVNNTLNTVKQFPTNLTDGKFVSTVYGNLLYNSTDGYVYGTTPLGGSDLKGNLYRFIFTGGTFTSTTQVTGVAYYSCDLEGDETGIDTMLWDKQLVTYTSSTYVNGTSLQGISCLTYCSTYVENPNVEVIIEDYTDLITDPCKKPTLINQCNIIYATHIDNDIWYDGSVSVVLPTTDNNNTELGDFDIISTE